jgi:hypothetical protein
MDAKIDITPPSKSDSKDDSTRKELLWEAREESLIIKWKNEMLIKKNHHNKKGIRLKKFYRIFGIPACCIPIIVSGLTNELKDFPEILSYLMIATGIITTMMTFFNFSKTSQLHFEFENRYAMLVKNIEKEMQKPKKSRIACDVYVENIYLQYCYLDSSAPT